MPCANRIKLSFAAVIVLSVALLLVSGAAAQSTGSVAGDVKNLEGKPFADVTVVLKSKESGLSYTAKTDKNGHFVQIGIRPGVYIVSFTGLDPSSKQQVTYETNAAIAGGEEAKLDFNFKDILSKQTAEQAEARKKQQEDLQKFEGMKAHFEAGAAALDEAKQVKDAMMKLPADQRTESQEKLKALYSTAVSELEAAQKAAPEKDANLHLIYYKLGAAYDAAGKNNEAVEAYQKAIELKPLQAAYYNNLGNVLARQGKIPEAGQAYQKSADLDPAGAASAWMNYGIVLYNANRLKDAVDPFRKATTLDPKNADAWYLLGAALLASMETKKEGDKLIYVIAPGNVEAYQKYLELAPTGRYANDAKASLQALESLGAGVETKVKARKKP
jgi:tetratricopeptide (TPR) repeat protein